MRIKKEIDEFDAITLMDSVTGFFLVGIGGAGQSSLAMVLQNRGIDVSGCDSTASNVTKMLADLGIPVTVGSGVEAIRQGMGVVLSDAIPMDAPEPLRARELGCPLFRRSQVLAWLVRDRKVVAVAGSHGKTTTSSMVAKVLSDCGLDPLAIIGASVPEFGGPVLFGNGEWAVVEACEAYNGMLDLSPQIILLTNLEMEHIDFHVDYPSLVASMAEFVRKLPDDGMLVYCAEDPGAVEIAGLFDGPKVGYGPLDPIHPMTVPGPKNRLNAGGALQVAKTMGLPESTTIASLGGFCGAERRLQVLQTEPVVVVSDYAHTPTEIDASLKALKEAYPGRRVVVVYQPHMFSRTQGRYSEFAESLDAADLVVLTDIYPAREDPIPGVSSVRIVEALTKPMHYVPCHLLLPREVAKFVRDGDVVVGMGAGTIGNFAPAFIEEMKRRDRPTKILVACGGDSTEREVSLNSGLSVEKALRERGFDATRVDLSEVLLSARDLEFLCGADRPDVVFLAVHGTSAEDGAIQGLCQMLHLPYTGSGIQSSAIAMDKQMAKMVLAQAGLRVPAGQLVTSPEVSVHVPGPWVVKPNAQGSTVGVGFVKERDQLPVAIEKALNYDSEVLVEEWIVGMETSIAVMGDRALPPVEIAPATGCYDFASKYEVGATDEIIPARLPEDHLKRLQDVALTAHRALGCSGVSRTDVIVRGDEFVVLEVNTLPGLTVTSLVPNSAAAAGISFGEVCEWMVRDALKEGKTYPS